MIGKATLNDAELYTLYLLRCQHGKGLYEKGFKHSISSTS
jgi:hypothetical protein